MVNVVVVGIVGSHELERVPWKLVAAVVIDSLQGGKHEQHNRLACGQTGDQLCDTSTNTVENEALNGVIVQSTVGVRHIEPVVHRVECLVEERVVVCGTVKEVLPCVDDEPVNIQHKCF